MRKLRNYVFLCVDFLFDNKYNATVRRIFMKITKEHAEYGLIVFEENVWTGKKKLSINGKPLQKVGKTTFTGEGGKTVFLKGNYFAGCRLQLDKEEIVLTPALKWYEIVLSVIPLALILVWGNSVALCSIVPVVGGLIGGVVSALFSVLNVMLVKSIKNVWLKIAVTVVMTALTFLACYLIALVFLSAVMN